MFTSKFPGVAGLLSVATLMTGCGGSSEPLLEDEGKVGLYSSTFRRNQTLSLMTFEGGLTYGFYQSDFTGQHFPEYAYAGFFLARPQSPGGGSDRKGVEFYFDAESSSPISLSPPIEDAANSASLATTLHTPTYGSEPISALKASVDQLPTDTTTLPGEYVLQARSNVGSFKGIGTLSSMQTLAATDGANCHIDATLSPRSLGNIYTVHAMVGPHCAIGSGEFSGHGLQAYAAKNVFLLLTNPTTNVGILLLLSPK